MIVTMIRSSALSNYIDMCEQQYFITYTLGHSSPANLKADMGSIVHLVLEWIAILKMQYDEGNEKLSLKTKAIDVEFNKEDLYTVSYLTNSDIDKINKSRKNKQIYRPDALLEYGHTRIGSKVVNTLITNGYKYFSEVISPDHNWANTNFKQVWNWTWMALEQNKRIYDPRFRKIVQPEEHFNIEIKKPWAEYEYFLNGEKIKGNLTLKGTIDLVTEIDKNTIEIIDWKALPIETLLPTPNGWTTMGEVQVGEILFDKDGKETKVIGKSNIKKNKCYEIFFDDKTSVISDVEHIWYLCGGECKPANELKIGDVIPITKPIEVNKKDLPIDPYVLGVWLGNGRNRSGEISSPFNSVFTEIENRGYELGEDIGNNDNCESRTIFSLTNQLKKLNLLHNKHIPEIYFRSSISQRLDLLRGLMDSDGNVNKKRKQAVFTTCNKTLSDDVKKLLITLGQRVNQSSLKRDTNYKNNINIFPLHFRPININPFLVKEKANKVDINWGPGRSDKKRIVDIRELDGEYTVQCIKVDSDTNTFLCTENMIPTHNTGRMFNFGKNQDKTYETLQKDIQLMFYYYAAKQIFPQYENIIITINFIRDGGPQTICFDKSDYLEIEKKIEETFTEIKNNNSPKLLDPTYKDHRCNKFCYFYKKKVGGKPFCAHIKDRIEEFGIDYVTETETADGFTIGHYEAPGE